jgi:CxxC-x17-CxxC domain-containing protein
MRPSNKSSKFGKRGPGRPRGSDRSSGPGRFSGPSRSRDSSSRGDFGRPRRNSRLEMTSVVCAKCGKSCEVPFKPSSDKPVYCRICFSSDGPSGPGNRFNNRSESKSGPSSEDIDKINRKLDKIMRALKID